MADLGWGGVPRIAPSDTALKYLNGFHKILKEQDLPSGAHLRANRIMEGIRGFKHCKKDLSESYDNYYRVLKRIQREPIKNKNEETALGPRKTLCQIVRKKKPGAGIGWTEPRKEAVIGLVDIRLSLPGYVGGVKKRDSQVADK